MTRKHGCPGALVGLLKLAGTVAMMEFVLDGRMPWTNDTGKEGLDTKGYRVPRRSPCEMRKPDFMGC